MPREAETVQYFEPVAVAVLTGFLGSGKTTLLNRLLKAPGMEGTAVIVNEFGEVGIDHLLVEQAVDGVIELSDGCLCCTVRGELVDTLADLIDRMQTGRIPPLKRIIIETTGLADPVPVLQSILGHPALAAALRLSGVVATVDALNGETALTGHEEAVRQVAVADRIVLTKSDIAPASGELLARLKTLNPRAETVMAADAAVRELVEAGLHDPAPRQARLAAWLGEEDNHDHHDHGHHHDDHGHHHHHHDDRITSFSLVHDKALTLSTIEMFLDLVRSTHGDSLLRMKGVVELAEDPERPLVIHGVGRFIHPPARLPSWPVGPRGARLVLIGMDLDRDHVERLFSAFVGKPSIDTPDRAALEANPLAVPGFPGR
ncbi:GTP-binding protein [Chelativorans sp. ZYF759]|nr:GTP-binding protein [Chelativorans sp. ZYF759]